MYDRINFQRYSIRTNVDAKVNKNLTISADIDASARNTNQSAYAPESIFDDIVAASSAGQSLIIPTVPFSTPVSSTR